MRTVKLTPPRFAFIIATRALLAAGVGLLLSNRLSFGARQAVGTTLVAVGVVTTVPALLLLRASVA